MGFLLTLLALAAPAFADPPASACRELAGLGCWYLPDSLRDDANAPAVLLVYIRGIRNDSAHVRAADRLQSARESFTGARLGRLADSRKVAVIVSGSADAGVTRDHVLEVVRAESFSFTRLVVAAHSGGYRGLEDTLDAFQAPDRIVMLDNFYFVQTGSSALEPLSVKLKRATDRGSACVGFHTDHNKAQARKLMEKVRACSFQDGDSWGHGGGVSRCLGTYLSSATCR